MNIDFKEAFKDIVDVDDVEIFWFGDKTPLTMEDLAFAAGERRDSALCGFKFKSKINPAYTDLEIVFCCKLRSKIYRRAPQNPSQWFAFLKMPEKHQLQVLSKDDLMLATDFDIDKFFSTQYFLRNAGRFTSEVKNSLSKIPEISDPGPLNIRPSNLNKNYYTKAIKEAIPLITTPRFNNKTFPL